MKSMPITQQERDAMGTMAEQWVDVFRSISELADTAKDKNSRLEDLALAMSILQRSSASTDDEGTLTLSVCPSDAKELLSIINTAQKEKNLNGYGEGGGKKFWGNW